MLWGYTIAEWLYALLGLVVAILIFVSTIQKRNIENERTLAADRYNQLIEDYDANTLIIMVHELGIDDFKQNSLCYIGACDDALKFKTASPGEDIPVVKLDYNRIKWFCVVEPDQYLNIDFKLPDNDVVRVVFAYLTQSNSMGYISFSTRLPEIYPDKSANLYAIEHKQLIAYLLNYLNYCPDVLLMQLNTTHTSKGEKIVDL